jgi:hypothetical protein
MLAALLAANATAAVRIDVRDFAIVAARMTSGRANRFHA